MRLLSPGASYNGTVWLYVVKGACFTLIKTHPPILVRQGRKYVEPALFKGHHFVAKGPPYSMGVGGYYLYLLDVFSGVLLAIESVFVRYRSSYGILALVCFLSSTHVVCVYSVFFSLHLWIDSLFALSLSSFLLDFTYLEIHQSL